MMKALKGHFLRTISTPISISGLEIKKHIIISVIFALMK
jgi:hypothetical protein